MEEDGKAEDDHVRDGRDEEYEEYLYQRIRQIQNEINTHPITSFRSVAQGDIQEQLQHIKNRFSRLGSTLHGAEQHISSVNQEITQLENVNIQTAASSKQLERESGRGRTQGQINLYMLKNTADTILHLSDRLQDSLIKGRKHSRSEYERRRWQYGFDVQDKVRNFVEELQIGQQISKLAHDFDDYPPIQGVPNFVQPSEIPWQHAVRTIATGRGTPKIAATNDHRVRRHILPCSSNSTTRKVRS